VRHATRELTDGLHFLRLLKLLLQRAAFSDVLRNTDGAHWFAVGAEMDASGTV